MTEVKNGTPRHSLSMMASADEIVNPISMDCHSGFFGLEKSMMLETLEHALEELIKMATLQVYIYIYI